MHIFIDESGQFIPLAGTQSRAAATLALVIPSSQRVALARAFRRLKRQLGAGGSEIKGSALSEHDTAQVITLLRRYDVIAEAVVLDAGQHYPDEISAFKAKQAESLMTHITREYQPTLVQDLMGLQEKMKALSNQLFLQVFCMWQLVPRLLETATMYYSQRRPMELGSFVWRVDAKDAPVTTMEHIWTTLIGPLITTQSATNPMGMIPGADYSSYERFDTVPPGGDQPLPGRFYTDMKKVLRDEFKFVSSKDDLGVQLADILASAVTRALNGKLKSAGWEALGTLFVRRSEQTVRLIALAWDADKTTARDVKDPHWVSVLRHWESLARPMLTKRTVQFANERDSTHT